MRHGGASALLYPMRLLIGAELIVDGEVAARAVRDEPRRALDRIAGEARRVTLRLIFDDAAHPDFELDLWLAEDALRHNARPPAAAIQEARGWLARAEAILRRPAPTPQPTPNSTPAPVIAASPPAAWEPEPEAELDDDPPWEDDPPFEPASEVEPDPARSIEPPVAPKPPKPKSGDDGLPIPPLDEPIQPYLL